MKFLVFGLGSGEIFFDLLIDSFVPCDKLFGGRILGKLFIALDSDLDGAAGVETVIRKEWGQQSGGMLSVVVREFCKGEELEPVVLLIIAEDSQKLFQDLVDSLRLPVRLRMIRGRFVVLYLAQFVESFREARDKLSTPIRDYVSW